MTLLLETRNTPDDDPTLDDAIAAVDEIRSAVEESAKKISEDYEADKTSIEKRLDDLDKRINRPAIITEKTDDEETIEKRAFDGYLRHGTESLQPDEVKALNLGTDAEGGYLADDDFEATLIKNLVEISPVRKAARATNISSGAIKIPVRTGSGTANWVEETADRPETEPSYGQLTIAAHEAACYIDVSNQLLEDSEINLAAELSSDFAEEFARLESEAFINGNGTAKPKGFMNGATTIDSVNGGDAALITSDGMIDLFYSMPGYYRNRGVWMLNSTSLGAIRKLKDGDGNYLWKQGIAEGQPETILGRPVADTVDMPDIAANAFPVAFGDFEQGYRIVDRVALSILRDPYSQATKGLTRFHARRRVGGTVAKAEALRKLKIAA